MTKVRKQSENVKNLMKNMGFLKASTRKTSKSSKNFMNFLLFFGFFLVSALILDIIFRNSLLCFFLQFFFNLKSPQRNDSFFSISWCFLGFKRPCYLYIYFLKNKKSRTPSKIQEFLLFFTFFTFFVKKWTFFSPKGGQLYFHQSFQGPNPEISRFSKVQKDDF